MGHQLVAPARAPPCHAGGEIDCRIGLLPGPLPKSDGGVFVFGAVGTQLKAVAHGSKAVMPGEARSEASSPRPAITTARFGRHCGYLSVSFSSMRRLRL